LEHEHCRGNGFVIDITKILPKISVGKLCPSMRLSMVHHVGLYEEKPALGITIHVVDAASDDNTEVDLFQCCPLPERPFNTELAAVEWIYGRVRAVLLHELDEFFKFDGVAIKAPIHPIPD
jgi:hypothetical protein